MDKIIGITMDKMLIFLLDALKDLAARQIVANGIHNGNEFEAVS